MANGASKIFNIMQKTNVNTISEYIALRVSSINPLTLTDDDKLIITDQFCQFNTEIDKSKISVGDIFNAVTLNDNQVYLITDVKSSKNELLKYNNTINELSQTITDINLYLSSLQNRIKELEDNPAGNNYVTGQEYKTLDTLDGKPIYFRRYYFDSMPDNTTATKPLGFQLSEVDIIKLEGVSKSNSDNYFDLSTGDYNGNANASVHISVRDRDNAVTLQTVNGNFIRGYAYVNVYYIYKEEDN